MRAEDRKIIYESVLERYGKKYDLVETFRMLAESAGPYRTLEAELHKVKAERMMTLESHEHRIHSQS